MKLSSSTRNWPTQVGALAGEDGADTAYRRLHAARAMVHTLAGGDAARLDLFLAGGLAGVATAPSSSAPLRFLSSFSATASAVAAAAFLPAAGFRFSAAGADAAGLEKAAANCWAAVIGWLLDGAPAVGAAGAAVAAGAGSDADAGAAGAAAPSPPWLETGCTGAGAGAGAGMAAAAAAGVVAGAGVLLAGAAGMLDVLTAGFFFAVAAFLTLCVAVMREACSKAAGGCGPLAC